MDFYSDFPLAATQHIIYSHPRRLSNTGNFRHVLMFRTYDNLKFFYSCPSLQYLRAFMHKCLILPGRDLCTIAAEDFIIGEINQTVNPSSVKNTLIGELHKLFYSGSVLESPIRLWKIIYSPGPLYKKYVNPLLI